MSVLNKCQKRDGRNTANFRYSNLGLFFHVVAQGVVNQFTFGFIRNRNIIHVTQCVQHPCE